MKVAEIENDILVIKNREDEKLNATISCPKTVPCFALC